LPKTNCICEAVESFRGTVTLTFVNISYLWVAALLIKLFCKKRLQGHSVHIHGNCTITQSHNGCAL